MYQCFFCNYFFKFVKRKKKKKKKINNQKILDERDTTDIEDIYDIINVQNRTYCSALYQGTDTTNVPKDEDIEYKCQNMDTSQITRNYNYNTVTYQCNHNENKDDSNSSTTYTYNTDDNNNMKEIEIFNDYVDKICNSDKHKKNYTSILLNVYNDKGKKTHFNRNLLRRVRNNKHWNYSADRQYLKFINYYRIKKIKKEIIRLIRFINLYLSLHYCKRAINSLICIKKYSNKDIMNGLIRIKKERKAVKKKNNMKNIFFESTNYSEINDTYNNIHMDHNFNGENFFSYFKNSSKFISAFNNLYMLFISEMCKIEHTKKYVYSNPRIDNNKNKLAYLYIKFLKNCIKIITNLEIKKIKNRRQIQNEKNVSSHYSNINEYMKKEIFKSKYIKSVIYICNTYLQNIENTHFYNITKLKEYYSFIKKCDININRNNCKVQCNKPYDERLYINNYKRNKKERSNLDRIIYLYINGGVINIKRNNLKKCGLNCFIKLKGNKFAHLFLEKGKNNEIKEKDEIIYKEKTKYCKEMEKVNDIYYMVDALEIQHNEKLDKINENMTSLGNNFRVNRKDTHKTTYISLSIQRDEQISNIKKIKEEKYIYKQRKYCNITGKNNNKNYNENGKSRKDKICKRILLTKSTKKYTYIKNKDNTTRVKQIIKSYSKIYATKKGNDKINKIEQTINNLNDGAPFCNININLKGGSKIAENFKGWNTQDFDIVNERNCKETINSLDWDEFNEFPKNEKFRIFGNEDNFNNLNNEYNRYTNKNNYENNTINIFIDCLEKCEYIKNNFKFIELIKDNTINFLYKCYDIKNNKNVVIKCVNKEKQLSIMSYNTYTNIYKIIKKIDNENIIKIYDVLENQSHFFIIMELCEGTDLVDYVSNENISFEKIKDIIFQLLSGISALHDNFIIHRDIKLDNLMFKDKNFEKLVIIDFDMSIYICAKDQIYPSKSDCIYTSETKNTIYDNKFDENYMNMCNSDQLFSKKIGISGNFNTEFSEKSKNNICKEENNAATSNTFTDYANQGKHENPNKMENHDSMNIKNSCLYKNEPNMNTLDSNNTYTNKVTENDRKCSNLNSWHFSNSYDYIKNKNKTHNKKSTSLDYNYIRKIENNFLSTNTRDIQKPFINNEDKIIYNDLIIGTKEYMSPHCLKGMYSTKTDIYSVGVTIFLIIFKSFPYLFEEISIDKWEDEIINKNKEIVIPFSFLFHNVNCTYFIKLMDLHLINNNIYFCNDSCLLDDNLKEIAKIRGIKFDFDKIKINQKNIYLVEILRKALSLDVCDQYSNVSQIMESSLFN
ncbi:serine/threonine protein kinase, putative [Plasmodium berghei]|uniref:Serine/threonine protein kinase, putative n=3 Tax=Plasmodium berghei TaxID=5821 RepID=A0A509AI59_PLABA|nr:serine/threonine protein kinase, putative [Plasmodium berghei ANKA]SCO60690.1 serine/threonine protein kinase, putative [Plasmodium berghei]VUC55179.1 serine/threonine protein kinase, putative [Plasmodium berghei ANKA]|eukprot:XP_034420992.1 serine/threonine protein kinase, putative [Plasmodium berghei ANKA]